MNLFDSSFLCLDIGSATVRAMAHRVRSGRIVKSALHNVESSDTVFAIKSAVDELEKQIGTRFDSAYVTGDFGECEFKMIAKNTTWNNEHKITSTDIKNQASQISADENFFPIHIIPLRYDTTGARNLVSPIGQVDRSLSTVFAALFYNNKRMTEITSALRSAHLQLDGMFDPSFLMNDTFRDKKQTAMFIDFGAAYTSISIWTERGPLFMNKIHMGQNAITKNIASGLNISIYEAERIKRAVSCVNTQDMDRFTPADASYDFSRADLNDIFLPMLDEIFDSLKESCTDMIKKYLPTEIYISGGGSHINGIEELVRTTFELPVRNIGADAAVYSLATNIWKSEAPRIKAYLARREKWKRIASRFTSLFNKRKPKKRFIPIMPTTLSFDMKRPETYSMFALAGISMIHVDIMDGFFVDRIVSGVDDLKQIRERTNAHLHVHLMTESPVAWASAACDAGADTVIVSTHTAGVRAALKKIREKGKRCGIALNPETSVDILKPVLKEIDEILIMSVRPGAGGQKFEESVLQKISVLANTRKRYGLKYKISVDGGINADTAQKCWLAGADYLASGSYLARSSNFAMAVQSLLRHE